MDEELKRRSQLMNEFMKKFGKPLKYETYLRITVQHPPRNYYSSPFPEHKLIVIDSLKGLING